MHVPCSGRTAMELHPSRSGPRCSFLKLGRRLLTRDAVRSRYCLAGHGDTGLMDRITTRRASWLLAAAMSLLITPVAQAQPTCTLRPEFETLRGALHTGLVGSCVADERTEASG